MTTARRQSGLSIVEVMVGLMVGSLVTLAAWGSVMFYESNRRTGMSGNSALENALATALTIQRDVKAAGLGFVSAGRVACERINVYHDGVTRADGDPFGPVSIRDGGAQSDEITVAYGNSILGSAPLQVTANMSAPSDPIRVGTAGNVAAGEMVLVAGTNSAQPCTLMEVTQATPTSFGVDLSRSASVWNPGSPESAFSNAQAYPANSGVIRTGALSWVTYRINNARHLEVVDNLTGEANTLAENIVLLKAQYGVSNGIAPQIEQWISATDVWAPPLDAAHMAALRAVRIVVVGRAPQREKPAVADGPCDATTAAPEAWADGPTLDLSADPDWQCYRYKTLMLTIPLKNIIFGGQA